MTDRSELTTAVGPWNQMMRLLQAWGDTPAGLRAIEYAAAQRDRARQPSPERSEKDSAALRAASRDYLLHDGSGIGRDDEWRGDFDAMALSEARDRLRAALAALPSNVSEPDSEALRLLRARIDAEPFFPKGDGPSIGNAAAFRDYKRRILAALPPSDPPALAQPSASIDVERLAQALFYSIGPGNLNGYPYDDEYRAIFRENANDTLAEYAALSAQPEAQPAKEGT